MLKKTLSSVILILYIMTAFCQSGHDRANDTVKFINPAPDLFKEEFILCKPAEVFLFYDTIAHEMVYPRKNFTDQFLQVCSNGKILPASLIWGYNIDNKYYRSGHTHDYCYVFGERIVKGKMSLYYCRNLPNIYGQLELMSTDPKHPDYTNRMIVEDRDSRRFKNDFSYFISPASDSSKMIFINNKNIGKVADAYLKDSPEALKDAKHFVQNYRIAQILTLCTGVTCYFLCLIDHRYPGITFFNYKNPLFYISLASIGTYIGLRIKGKNRYLSPNDMIRIISKYNGQYLDYHSISK